MLTLHGRAITGVAVAMMFASACGASGSGVESVSASQTLAAAIDRASQTAAYRVTSYSGQRQLVGALGIDIDSPIDPTRPTAILEVDAAGESYTVIDLEPILPPGTPGADALGAELWQNAARVVADTSSYQAIVDLNPAADLGVFRPGFWSADLAAIDADASDVVTALGGGGGLDPRQLGESFLAAITGIDIDPTDPNRYNATTTYGALVRATGQDVDVLARTASDGISAALGTDPDALAVVYAEVYEEAPTELAIEIVDGQLRTLEAVIDLSAIWPALSDAIDELGLVVTDADRTAIAGAAVNAVYQLEVRSEFVFDDSIDIVIPDGPTEDRTKELGEYLAVISGD